jgi:PAS domain S-box-containing protein
MDLDVTEFFKEIIEHTEESIFLINAAGTIIFTAQEFTKDLEGKKFLDAVAKIHHKRLERAVQDAFESKSSITCELKGQISTPHFSWFSCRISPVLKEDKVKSAVVFAADITEPRAKELTYKKKIQKKLRKFQLRVRVIENILTMCAKTKKIQFKGEWLNIEDFLWKRYGFKISHDLSPEAVEEEWKVIDEMELIGKQQLREIDSS